jgi:Dyp-type peroxidase family
MPVSLNLDDIQSAALRPRPHPYVGCYLVFRIDDKSAGRALLRDLLPALTPAVKAPDCDDNAWISVVISYEGFRALGVPQVTLDSFAPQFRQGMAARAEQLGDVGESAPENWEKPLGTPDVHLALSAMAPDKARLDAVMARAHKALEGRQGISLIWTLDCFALASGKEAFGFKDGISQPAIEDSGIPGTNPHEVPLKAGEFILGYEDETGAVAPMPQPEVLGRNGTYVVFRKLHQRVAAFRQYTKANARSAEEEELLAAKMMGRWRSGCPLALSPGKDDPALGADDSRNNAFMFRANDPGGHMTPPGSHIRRMNPRDADIIGVPRLHRMIRRGTNYGVPLPDGVLEDDGVDRGLAFLFIGTHLDRQFEFVQSEWIKDGVFIGQRGERDPIAGPNDGSSTYTIPNKPIRRRMQGIPRFVVTRGGEYFFAPSLTALRWLSELTT